MVVLPNYQQREVFFEGYCILKQGNVNGSNWLYKSFERIYLIDGAGKESQKHINAKIFDRIHI